MSHFHSIRESHRGTTREETREPALISWIHAIGTWLVGRRLRQDLSDLDDRLLDDVGISRDVVRRLGKPPWWP
jgi:uncharacterized protein YjiS (DUF1127 family)